MTVKLESTHFYKMEVILSHSNVKKVPLKVIGHAIQMEAGVKTSLVKVIIMAPVVHA